ncbi:hypothetical protein V2G26_007663 [Clonostachys chloroleuca]
MAEVESIHRQQQCTSWSFAADFFSAACAAALVAPWVNAIDKMIYYRVAKGDSFKDSCKSFLSKPKKLLGAFHICFLVYFGTYATANLLNSFCTIDDSYDPATMSASSAKLSTTRFCVSAAVGTGLCLYKDGYVARAVGKASLPLFSYILFAARDATTCFTSFQLPPLVAQLSASSLSNPALNTAKQGNSELANLASLAAAQLVSTPIHVLGLDLHNRRKKSTARQRIQALWKHAPAVSSLRMARVMPTFFIGNSVNTTFRSSMIDIGL